MKESIIEAAYDYATEKTKFRKDVLKEVDADTYVSRHSDCMEDFQCGAQWQAQQSPWIRVKDRLPEKNTPVLFIVEFRGIHKDYFGGLYKCGKWETEQRTYDSYSFFGIVTHWMPIPKINE